MPPHRACSRRRARLKQAMDVSATVDEKWHGLNCHRTQFGPSNLFRRLP